MRRIVYNVVTRTKTFIDVPNEPVIDVEMLPSPEERISAIEETIKSATSSPVSVPIRGTDYWTTEDISEIHSYINAQLGVIENGYY